MVDQGDLDILNTALDLGARLRRVPRGSVVKVKRGGFAQEAIVVELLPYGNCGLKDILYEYHFTANLRQILEVVMLPSAFAGNFEDLLTPRCSDGEKGYG
jgi:hypothetical protein